MFKGLYNILLASLFKVYVKAENTCFIAKMRIKKWIILFCFEIKSRLCFNEEEIIRARNKFVLVTNRFLNEFQEESHNINNKHVKLLNQIMNN